MECHYRTIDAGHVAIAQVLVEQKQSNENNLSLSKSRGGGGLFFGSGGPRWLGIRLETCLSSSVITRSGNTPKD